MGVDFIERIGRSYKKHLDNARVRLGTSDLFTQVPVEDRPTYPVRIFDGTKIEPGQNLVVEVEGPHLVYRNVLSIVAIDKAPTPELYQAAINSNNTAIATVKEFHTISSVAEVSFW